MKKSLILLTIIAFSACSKGVFDPEPDTDARSVFEYLWTSFSELYAPAEEREIDWEVLYQQYAPQLDEESTDEELYAVLTDMLGTLDDTHVCLVAPGREVFYANRYYRELIDDELFNRELIRNQYLKPGFTYNEDEGYTYGLIGNDVGYIWFDFVGSNWKKLDNALHLTPNQRGLVLDLRHNQGGDFTYALEALVQINPENKEVFRSRTKSGPGPNDFTNWYTWEITGGGTKPGFPIVVLTDRYTVSAGERAVMALRALDGITVIGDTTNGSVSTAVPRQLPNGWTYRLATQDVIAFDGQVYEGRGIPPHIQFQNTPADIAAGRDRVLERALEFIQ